MSNVAKRERYYVIVNIASHSVATVRQTDRAEPVNNSRSVQNRLKTVNRYIGIYYYNCRDFKNK